MKEKANLIVERATTLFTQNGFHWVSMDYIASYCGISKKTLYRYFESKEMLVETIVQKLIVKTDKYIRLSPDIAPNAVKEMENFSDHIMHVLEVLTPKFIRDLKKYYPAVYTRLIVFKANAIVPYLERCVNRGIKEEIFRPDIIERNTGWLYCWQIQNVLESDTSQATVNRIIQNINDLFLHGILNSKGLKTANGFKQPEHAGPAESR